LGWFGFSSDGDGFYWIWAKEKCAREKKKVLIEPIRDVAPEPNPKSQGKKSIGGVGGCRPSRRGETDKITDDFAEIACRRPTMTRPAPDALNTGLVRAAGLKPEKRQANPTKRESCRARNGNCRNWDRKPDDLSAHIDHRKGWAGGTIPRPTSLPGIAAPVKPLSGGMRCRFNGPAAIFFGHQART